MAICRGTGCTSSASAEVQQALQEELDEQGLGDQVEVRRTGCFGFCEQGPIMVVYPDETFYTKVKPRDVKKIVAEHIIGGKPVEKVLYHDPASEEIIEKWHEIGFYGKQQRILLENCGVIDPENIDHYRAKGGYQALHKALTEMTPEEVIEEVLDSGVRGRGGAGFPAGMKWRFARNTQAWPKYVICNADEGDPGAFMDRSVLEGDPHALIEGMVIAGYAIGASAGYIYCRAEYPLAIKRLEIALAQAKELGLLGENILGSDFDFDLIIKEGAGAFVCGEETALMASIQGDRGQPWPRPPYPAVSGLWEQPSNVNNVKSYAYVPRIIHKGADWFKSVGTEKSPGTAVFALTGMVNRTGLIEVPMGITLREIIYDIGGGIPNDKKFKAVQTGGPLGGCLPETDLDIPVDFDSLAGSRFGDGFGRYGHCRRVDLHGRVFQILYAVHLRRELWKMPALPHRQHPYAGDFGAHYRRRRKTGRPGRNPVAGQRDGKRLAVCAGTTGARAGDVHPACTLKMSTWPISRKNAARPANARP